MGNCLRSIRRTRSLVVRTFSCLFAGGPHVQSNKFGTCLCGTTQRVTLHRGDEQRVFFDFRSLAERPSNGALIRRILQAGRQGRVLRFYVSRLGSRCQRALCLACFRNVDCRRTTRIVKGGIGRVAGVICQKGRHLHKLLRQRKVAGIRP